MRHPPACRRSAWLNFLGVVICLILFNPASSLAFARQILLIVRNHCGKKRPTLRLLDIALQIRTKGITAPSLQSTLLRNTLLQPTRTKVLPAAGKKRRLVPIRKGRLSDVGEYRHAYSGFISTALVPTETSQAKPQEKYREEIVRLDEHLLPALTRFLRDAGVSFAEYALVASLIVVVCVIALLALGKGT